MISRYSYFLKITIIIYIVLKLIKTQETNAHTKITIENYENHRTRHAVAVSLVV